MRKIRYAVGLAVLASLMAPLAQASESLAQGKVPACGKVPAFVRDAERTLAYCITTDPGAASCKEANFEGFANNEGRLPAAGHGEEYRAGRAQNPQVDAAGRNRVVFRANQAERKSIIVARYFTSDHYETFCEL
jgi:guanyl-specific ribonuclease Sa